jgi:hypothetical protein
LRNEVIADVAENAANTDRADRWECVAPGMKWLNAAPLSTVREDAA